MHVYGAGAMQSSISEAPSERVLHAQLDSLRDDAPPTGSLPPCVIQLLHALNLNGKCSEAVSEFESEIRNTCVRRISRPSSLVSVFCEVAVAHA